MMPNPFRRSPRHHGQQPRVVVAALVLAAAVLGGCSSSDSSSETTLESAPETTIASAGTDAPGVTAADSRSATGTSENSGTSTDGAVGSYGSALRSAKWADGVTLKVVDGSIEYTSNGIPNHVRQAEYALPNAGVRVPSAATASAGADPTLEQSYDFTIPTTPTKAAKPTETSLGTIGLMISGAALFNPYEGDGTTVATASNFTVKNAKGEDIAFLDSCSGHPTPMGEYHYHALPKCVTAQVDTDGGPSHIIGVAFDGYPIYGNRDINGAPVTAAQLDGCNGITSPTPEFPNGAYHYVLLAAADATSSIRCFTGEVDSSLSSMPGMHGMR